MARVLLAITTALIAAATVAQAQPAGHAPKVTVALLPLDADAKLAIYGQPVAAEVARALVAEGLDVAMVGQGDPVPTRAVLVVDGKIRKAAGRGSAIVLDLRVSDPAKAEVLARVSSTASSLTAIDRAAGEVAQKLVPAVRTQLAARQPPPRKPEPPPPDKPPVKPAPPPPPGILLIASSRVPLDGSGDAAMVAAIAPAFEDLIGVVQHRPVAPAAPIGDAPDALPRAIKRAGAHLAIVVEVLGFQFDTRTPQDGDAPVVPLARARARVRILGRDGGVIFDRVVRTDTVVGRAGEGASHMARHAATQIVEVIRTRVVTAAGAAR